MSIWDYFNGSGSPEQGAGLVGLAAGFNSALGDGSRPVNLGAALSAGALGMQQGRQQHVDREREKQALALQSRLLNYKVQDAESDLKNQEALRQRAEGLRQFYISRGTGGAGVAAPAADGGAGPAGGAPAQLQTGGGNGAIYQQRLAEAQALRAAGYGPEADAAEAAALKFQPKVSGWKEVKQAGKVLYAPFYEDGSNGAPVPLEVAKQLEKVNAGGRTELVDSYTGNTVRSIQNTVTPDAALSASVSRENSIRTDARARDFNAITQEANAIKRGEKQRDADLGKAGQVASFDTMLGTLDRLKTHPGLARSTGLTGKLPTIPGSDSANFQAELETFKSQAFVPMVAQLKGMGALSDAEGRKLTAAVGALDPNMSESAFRASIDRVVNDMASARKRVVGSASADLQRSLAAPEQTQQPQAAAPRAPMKGQVVDGYRFKGGNPADPNSWERK